MEYDIDGIYAVVKKYATSEGTYKNGYEDDGFKDWFYRPNEFDKIYNKVMEITDGDHEIAQDVASWAELATVEERYEFREGEVEIQYIS